MLRTAFETVYFWPGLVNCFGQVEKVLKQGGYFPSVNESDDKDAAGRKFEKIIDEMKSYTAEEIEAVIKAAGFSKAVCDHHPPNPWISLPAVK